MILVVLYMTINDIFTLPNLLRAHNKAKKSKLFKNEVIRFELNKAHEICKLCEELNNNKYHISEYRHFTIYEPKKRDVDATAYRDRVVQHALVDNYLFPLLENRLVYDNAACRINKGTDFARKRLKSFIVEAYRKYGNKCYVLTFDIHHYFESIDHQILKERLKRIINNDDIYRFITMIIDSFHFDSDKGLPLGNQTSQCFALYYLDAFDRIIKERYRIRYYSRYMDDGVIICEDKNKLQRLNAELLSYLNSIRLEINQKKNKIYPLSQGITYLGFRYFIGSSGKVIVRMAKDKKRRLVRHIKNDLRIVSYESYYSYLYHRSDDYRLIAFLKEKMNLQNKR